MLVCCSDYRCSRLARRNFIEEYLKAVEVPKKAQVPENSARALLLDSAPHRNVSISFRPKTKDSSQLNQGRSVGEYGKKLGAAP
jgi:hypothetical protein